ncbi:putative thiamine transport system substrate-binding protein [Chromohalobacter canadensis]|uniref:Putative thiamine transport system substrate-binding protein n=1 Tax=Chromohalobacter canadensis TaxID=141389 RepID=A0A285VIQ8_9GAMM|nr:MULTISPECIES: ABC transporter substrate-binding protein [Chromohalobacter]SOC53086.1 putative thiamine transport system substrate-binding protein [Chromohalobacter canadensis]
MRLSALCGGWLRGLSVAALLAASGPATAYQLDDWASVVAEARGQTVYFNAWGGEPRINRYLEWVADEVEARYGVELEHVKLADTATAVSRVLAEVGAGNRDEGAVDLIWLNGENFAAMKQHDLLYGPFAQQLPNYALTAPDAHPDITHDFTLPTEGYESPWGRAQLVFYYDSQRSDSPPRSMSALLDWAKAHPGRFTYPLVPDFLGSTFLKQALIARTERPEALQHPVEESNFEAVTAPLWNYLDTLHPYLWRKGQQFPDSGAALRQLMGDGELSLAFTFTPAEPAAAVADYQLPPSIRSYVLNEGTLGNVHFVAIPMNASHKAGALVLANFLLSPKAQARKQARDGWADASVLAMSRLDASQRKLFAKNDDNPAALPTEALGDTLPEPHPSWVERLEKAWLARYGAN